MTVSSDTEASIDKYMSIEPLADQKPYCRKIAEIYFANKTDIDALINKYSINWKTSRMAKLDLAILRLSVIEIKHLSDEIPVSASINEAVELAKAYGTDKAPKFINAILRNIASEEK